jgi:hypothetical protein
LWRVLPNEFNLILSGFYFAECALAMTTSAVLQGVRQFMNQDSGRQDPRFQLNSTSRR